MKLVFWRDWREDWLDGGGGCLVLVSVCVWLGVMFSPVVDSNAMCETCDYDEHVELGFVREMEIHPGAEDVKTVRFITDRNAVDVQITDHVMDDFLEIAERVKMGIHRDMAQVERLLDSEETST